MAFECTVKAFSKMTVPNENSNYFTPLPTLGIVSLLTFPYSGGCVVLPTSHTPIPHSSLIASSIEHLLLYVSNDLEMSSFMKSVFKFFAHF